jgi:hypothetical protein
MHVFRENVRVTSLRIFLDTLGKTQQRSFVKIIVSQKQEQAIKER